MIYPSESDIVTFLKGLVISLQPYAHTNEVNISFSSRIRKMPVTYQPLLLSQSIIQLTCNIINLLPPKSSIIIRLIHCKASSSLHAEIENTNINLVRVNELCSQTIYPFTGFPLENGTMYRLIIPLKKEIVAPGNTISADPFANSFPAFYRGFQKRMRSHFTLAEKRIATLEKNQPQEAAFMQKINALIKVNLENENFDSNVLCKAMSMSRTQLFRRMKLLVKQAPANYIKTIRLQKAKELLETTDSTVSEIAFKTGFQSISNFSKIFKKQYGIVPSVFRQTNRSATNK